MSMKTIITIQHTQSVHHTNGMVGSWTDWELTEQGKAQAERIGRKLAQELKGRRFTLVSSDLTRARQTAEIVGRAMGLSPVLAQALRERNLGRCVGQSVAWLRQNMECREHTVDDRLFADAESRRDEWQRLRPFFEQLIEQKEDIIVVSHGDLLGVFCAMWLRWEVEMLNRAELGGVAGGVSWLEENDEGKRVIRRLNDMSYVME